MAYETANRGRPRQLREHLPIVAICLLGEGILTKRTLLPLIVSPLSMALIFLMRPTEPCPAGKCQHDDQGRSANAEAHA